MQKLTFPETVPGEQKKIITLNQIRKKTGVCMKLGIRIRIRISIWIRIRISIRIRIRNTVQKLTFPETAPDEQKKIIITVNWIMYV